MRQPREAFASAKGSSRCVITVLHYVVSSGDISFSFHLQMARMVRAPDDSRACFDAMLLPQS